MKKIVFAGCVLVCAALTGCRSEKSKAEEGQPIGRGLIIKTTDEGKFRLYDRECGVLSFEDYDVIKDYNHFISAQNDGGITLFENDGSVFTSCDSFSIKKYYPIASDEKELFFLETVADSAYRAFSLDDLNSRSVTEGFKDGIWPTACGYSITKQGDLYQLDSLKLDDPVMLGCQEMHIINQKGKIVLLVKTDNFSGYSTLGGQGIKALTPSKYAAAKKSGNVLWTAEGGKISAIEKNEI